MSTKIRIAKAASVEPDLPLGTETVGAYMYARLQSLWVTTGAEYDSETAAIVVKHLNLT